MRQQDTKPAWALFFFIFSLASCWATIQPVYSVADEPQHVVKALAVSNWSFNGNRVSGQNGYPAMEFEVPVAYSNTTSRQCFFGNVDSSPKCAEEMSKDATKTIVPSSAAEYPPLYYALVGWVGWLLPGPLGLLFMRLLTALIFSVLIGLSGLVFTFERRFMGILALVIASTPMAMSFAGSVNPFAPEVAAAVLFWTSSSSVCRKPLDSANRKTVLALLYGAGFLFGIFRPGSFVWLLPVIVLAFIASIGPSEHSKMTWRGHPARHVIFSGLIGVLISVAWFIFGMQGRNLGGSAEPAGGSLFTNMRVSYENTDDFIRQLFGVFNWLEFYPPVVVPVLFFGLIVYMFAHAEPISFRVGLSLALTTLFLVFGPAFLEGARASSSGWGFQGRYLLPVAVGIPIMIADRMSGRESPAHPTCVLMLVAIGAHIIALNHVMRRFFSGLSGSYIWFTNTSWSGIVGAEAVVLALLALLASSTFILFQLRKSEALSTHEELSVS